MRVTVRSDCVVEIPVYFPDNNRASPANLRVKLTRRVRLMGEEIFFKHPARSARVTINNKSMRRRSRRRERTSFASCGTGYAYLLSLQATCTRDELEFFRQRQRASSNLRAGILLFNGAASPRDAESSQRGAHSEMFSSNLS